ncbi:MAG: hypothetical protein OXT49_11110 [Gammaproteobacteria bacterium]|nr:hypothetical protein [Gammaproteobacteria bacterium]
MNLKHLKTGIETYFSAEAAEMYCLVIVGVVLFVLAAVFWLKFSDRFSQGFAISLLVIGSVLTATCVGLLVRDTANKDVLLEAVHGAKPVERKVIFATETERMQKVVDNYPNLRYISVAFMLLGSLLILFLSADLARAAGVGMVLLGVSVIIIDQYSEPRARTYLSALERHAPR